MSPIELYSQPIYWNLDHTLQILKLPNYLILSDPYCPKFNIKLEDNSYVINPGNFGKNSEFVIIYP